jgi:two-component system sensor histidine kinase AtoS
MTCPPAARLQMQDISVRYGDVAALKHVDFDLFPGEIHALVGEHRAGKSTLVKLLSGAVWKDGGTIRLNDRLVEGFTPETSMRQKIGMVYQEINIVSSLSALENIFAGQTPVKWFGRINRDSMVQTARKLFARLKIDINLEVPLARLTMAEQLMVELVRLLSIDPEILIFDEISSKLTPVEMERVYSILFEAKRKNNSVIYISHNMDEIFRFADRVTILKDGQRLGTEEIKDLNRMKLINLTYSFVLSRQELEKDNKELYFLKRYNENIIKNLPVGVIILNDQNKLYLMNRPAVEILNLEEEQLADRNVAGLLLRANLREYDEIVRCVREREEGSWEEVNYGPEKTLRISTFPFKDEDYDFLGTIILLEDITQALQFNEYLRRAEKIASTAELAAGVAHEINNPLGIVLNYTNIIKRKALANKGGMEKVQIIEDELLRIKEIVSSLLSFSRIDNSEMAPLDLAAVIHDVILLINHKLHEKEINFLWSRPERELRVMGNANKLKQVFINLLVNSIEAVPKKGRIQIDLQADESNRTAAVTVRDNGCGIPEAIRSQIFNPFFTTKMGNKNTGLGLPISQHIIETHRGLIEVNTDGSTEFVVRLPLLES